jgi:thymidylate synthase (FAD)
MGSDKSIVNAARVSYGRNDVEHSEEKDQRLIKYLLVNKHSSPLEHVTFTFYFKTPIAIARQIMRHRTWAFNEISMRYTEAKDEFFMPKEWRGQSTDNKQMSAGPLPAGIQDYLRIQYELSVEDSYEAYQALIRNKASRELARMVLPVSTMTEFYGTVNLHNLMHFLKLRLHPHAQPEVQEVAQKLEALMQDVVPETYAIWKELNKDGL